MASENVQELQDQLADAYQRIREVRYSSHSESSTAPTFLCLLQPADP